MNKDIILGLVRHILTAVGGVFVTKGAIETSEAEALAGALVVLVGVVWSIVDKKKKQIG